MTFNTRSTLTKAGRSSVSYDSLTYSTASEDYFGDTDSSHGHVHKTDMPISRLGRQCPSHPSFDTTTPKKHLRRNNLTYGHVAAFLSIMVLLLLESAPLGSSFVPHFSGSTDLQNGGVHPVKSIGSFVSQKSFLHSTTSDLHSSMEKEKLPVSGSEIPESVRRRRLLLSLLATATGTTAASMPSSAAATQDSKTMNTMLQSDQDASAATIDWSKIEVMKPPLDDRDYELMILENGLRVVLCSDPSSNEAGAAMDVHVGACSDPKEIPGLAHFNEHMLFLGTKDYPKEDSFEEFLSANGGSSNAYVSFTHPNAFTLQN
jgi:Insulinase (Peptidase family M16)